MDLKKIFEYGLHYHHYANTAYPLTPHSLGDFRIKDPSAIPTFLKEEWNKSEKLSLYIHIPFCETRCKFCEYVVLEGDDALCEDQYVDLLLKEMDMYQPLVGNKSIVGFDVGGGTPTKLSTANLKRITDRVREGFNIGKDVVYSIETTPVIAAKDPQKINDVFNMGYKRISMGVQTVSERLLNELGREGTCHIYEQATQNIRQAGYTQFNIDLMYGFLNQSNEDFENTLRYAIGLNPEYITLYRNRYKGTKLEKEAEGVSLYKIISQYRLAYKILTESGYLANVGKNTFSRVAKDYGTSDYLTERVINGVSYLGMGLGAQSLGQDYLAYNKGAATKSLAPYKKSLEQNQFPIQDIYRLDKQESIAKMVSVAFYFGFVDFDSFQDRFGLSFLDHFKDETDYLLKEGLMEIQQRRIYLTQRGSDYINGVIPFFYSDKSREELSRLFENRPKVSQGEEEFLKAYKIEDYQRPSMTTDIALFIESPKSEERKLVMIRRGEHPFMNSWALPGGFVTPKESVEEGALRELKEETGVSSVDLDQLGVMSEPQRDPRGWIMSTAFVGITATEEQIHFGDDAIDAVAFDLYFKREGEGDSLTYKIVLSHEEEKLEAGVEVTILKTTIGEKKSYKILDSQGIAFDHSKIIAMAIDRMGW